MKKRFYTEKNHEWEFDEESEEQISYDVLIAHCLLRSIPALFANSPLPSHLRLGGWPNTFN